MSERSGKQKSGNGSAEMERRLTLEADLAAVRELRQSLLQLCKQAQVSDESAGDFALAVSEAFSNAIRHGVKKSQAAVEASIRVSTKECKVTLSYPGEPFTPTEPSLPHPTSTGGRGRYLMSVLADDVRYTFRSGMTQAELLKRW